MGKPSACHECAERPQRTPLPHPLFAQPALQTSGCRVCTTPCLTCSQQHASLCLTILCSCRCPRSDPCRRQRTVHGLLAESGSHAQRCECPFGGAPGSGRDPAPKRGLQLWRREIVRAVDMSSPHQWYSVARAVQRRIVYHTGPTNSGKTYEALQAWQSHGDSLGSGRLDGPTSLPEQLPACPIWIAKVQLVHFCSVRLGLTNHAGRPYVCAMLGSRCAVKAFAGLAGHARRCQRRLLRSAAAAGHGGVR